MSAMFQITDSPPRPPSPCSFLFYPGFGLETVAHWQADERSCPCLQELCQYWGMEPTSNQTTSGQRNACHLIQPEVRSAGLCSSPDRSGGRGYIKRSGRLTQDGISQLLPALLSLLHDYSQSHHWFHVPAGGGEGLR